MKILQNTGCNLYIVSNVGYISFKMKKLYKPRFIDEILNERLKQSGAILIQGPKGSGKTESALQVAKSVARMDSNPVIAVQMEVDPNLVLEGETPRLIDEWQEYPQIWNYVRHTVDERQAKGQFILTGSSTALNKSRMHSGAGRFSILHLRVMSSFERGFSTGEVSLSSLLNQKGISSKEVEFNLDNLLEQLIVGGWPTLLDEDVDAGLIHARDYVGLAAEIDVSKVSKRKHEPHRVKRLMQSIARNISTVASYRTLAESNSTPETIASYMEALERLLVVENLPAWSTHIRSSATLRKSPKLHFCDPSLAIGALGLSLDNLKRDLNYVGFLFESMVIRDLRIYADRLGGKVYHYRDSSGLEVDAIIELPDSSWAAFEIKMGFVAQDAGAESLLKLAAKIDSSKSSKPIMLAVITANGFAYERPDGVKVIPINTLTV